VHDDLGRNNLTTCYNCRFSAMSLALWVIFLGGTTEQHVKIIITCCLVVPPAIIAGSLVFRVIFSVSQLWNILGSFTEPFSYYQLKNSNRTPLSRVHTSTKAQQFPLIHSTPIQNQTQPCNHNPTKLLQGMTRAVGPPPNQDPIPNVTCPRLPSQSNGFFHGPCAT